MNAMSIINIIIWSYVGLLLLFLFVRWLVIKIKTKIEVKKALKNNSVPAELIEDVEVISDEDERYKK